MKKLFKLLRIKGVIIVITIFISLLSIGCSKKQIDKKNLTIIDEIVLGQSMDSLISSYSKMQEPQNIFYTKFTFNSISELQYNAISAHFTKVFDLSDYSNNIINLYHIGILYPTVLIGTNNVIQMDVLLVSTGIPFSINPMDVNNAIGNNLCIQQEVNELLISKIIEMYKSKYGEPKTYSNINNYNIYVIENNNIKKYTTGNEEGQLYIWENKFMKITFFTGNKSYYTTFTRNPAQYNYIISFGGGGYKKHPEIDYDHGIVSCYSFPYIEYCIKDTIISELGLKSPKI